MKDYLFFNFFVWMIDFTQQLWVLEVIFANKPPGLGLTFTQTFNRSYSPRSSGISSLLSLNKQSPPRFASRDLQQQASALLSKLCCTISELCCILVSYITPWKYLSQANSFSQNSSDVHGCKHGFSDSGSGSLVLVFVCYKLNLKINNSSQKMKMFAFL